MDIVRKVISWCYKDKMHDEIIVFISTGRQDHQPENKHVTQVDKRILHEYLVARMRWLLNRKHCRMSSLSRSVRREKPSKGPRRIFGVFRCCFSGKMWTREPVKRNHDEDVYKQYKHVYELNPCHTAGRCSSWSACGVLRSHSHQPSGRERERQGQGNTRHSSISRYFSL